MDDKPVLSDALYAEGEHALPETQLGDVTSCGHFIDRTNLPLGAKVELSMWIFVDGGWHFHGGCICEGGPLKEWPGKKEGTPEPIYAGVNIEYLDKDGKPIILKAAALKGTMKIIGVAARTSVVAKSQ